MPEQLGGDHEALRLAWDEVSKADLSVLAEASGARADISTGILSLRVMDRECAIDIRARTMIWVTDPRPVKPHMQVLVLHYLLGSMRAGPSGTMVTFREFEGGAFYFDAYRKRTLDILVSVFGSDAELLKRAGERMGGVPSGRASAGFRVQFFPRLAAEVLLWLGDDEVPASSNLLYDSGAGRMLTTEGITVLGGELVLRLVALSKA